MVLTLSGFKYYSGCGLWIGQQCALTKLKSVQNEVQYKIWISTKKEVGGDCAALMNIIPIITETCGTVLILLFAVDHCYELETQQFESTYDPNNHTPFSI